MPHWHHDMAGTIILYYIHQVSHLYSIFRKIYAMWRGGVQGRGVEIVDPPPPAGPQIAQRRRTGREYRRVVRRRFNLASRRWTDQYISLHRGSTFRLWVSFSDLHLTCLRFERSFNTTRTQYQRFHLYYLVKCEYNNGRDVPNLT